jgi:hypothetical protein
MLLDKNLKVLGITQEDYADLYLSSALQSDAVTVNNFNVFMYREVSQTGMYESISWNLPKHILQSRNGQRWINKGSISDVLTECELVDFELNSSQFPSSLFNTFFENALTPNAEYDLGEFLAPMLELILRAKRNSVQELAMFLNHPDIPAVAESTYLDVDKTTPNPLVTAVRPASMTVQTFLDFHDQQTIKYSASNFGRTGWVSKLDNMVAGFNPNGYAQHFHQIADADVNNGKYIGSVEQLFEDMIDASSHEMQEMIDSDEPPVFMVSSAVYKKYVEELKNLGTAIEYLELKTGGITRNAVMYDGIPVVKTNEFDVFGRNTGKERMRAILTAQQNIIILSKVTPVQNDVFKEEAGLIVQKSPIVRDKGRVDVFANSSVGAGYVEYKLVTYARSNENL